MQPSIRRGVAFAEDVRFCFTVFEDNEQFESGDTLEHTWWKKDWPVCTTKWLYIWGLRSGETCLSTTAPFKYHNDGVSPVPPPEPMYQLNAIDPQYYTFGGGSSWSLFDLSRDIPEDATGAVIQFRNQDTGTDRNLALRKPGASYDAYLPFAKDGTLWAIVGLDSQRRFNYRFAYPGNLAGYLMGYTGRDVVFPDDPIDIKPAANNAYSTFNIHATWPDAKFIFTDMGSLSGFDNYHSIRPLGSSKEVYQGANRCFPFCGVPASGNIQTKLYQRAHPSTRWLAYAYLKQDCSFSLNGVDFAGFTPFAWKTLDVGTLDPNIRWAFLEYQHPYGAAHLSARKMHSYFGYKGRNFNHGWMITHVHHDRDCQVYSDNTSDLDRLLQIAESH
ncbi:hypothetical protein ES705_23070 [subsurface metagenome]